MTKIEQNQEQAIDIPSLLRVIRKRFWIILLVASISISITAFYTLRQQKIYQATTTLQIETQAPRVLGKDFEEVATLGTGNYWTDQEYYETQYKIIESREVSERTVRMLKLNEDPDFMGVPPDRRSSFKPVTVTEAASQLMGQLKAEPIKDSRLVRISIEDSNPTRAQLLCNTLADAYIDQNAEQVLSSTVSALDWLSNQLEELRTKLETSENSLYAFKKNHDILSVSLEDRQNILASEISQITTNLTNVRTKRIELKARRDQIKSIAESKDPLSMPIEALNQSGLIQSLKEQHAQLRQQLGELSERYLDKHPRITEIKAKLDRVEEDIRREVSNVLAAIDSEYETSVKNEEGLKANLKDLMNQAQDLGQKEIDYNRLKREKDNNERLYQLVMSRSKETDLSRLLKVNNVRVLDSAMIPSSPIKPNVHLNILLSILIGLALGLGLVFLMEYLDRTIKTQEQIENMGIIFLGLIPSITAGDETYAKDYRRRRTRKQRKGLPDGERDLVVHKYPKSLVAESCRAIRTNILFMSPDDPIRRILVTSPSPREGKTTVAISLAITMAQSGSRVLLVDTDMRRPRIHRALGFEKKMGLSHAILGEADIENVIYPTEVPNLSFLPCGPPPPNPAELLHTERFIEVVHTVSEMFDRVVFDSPPIGVVTDAAILSRLVDGTLVVIKPGWTTKEAAQYVLSTLKDIGSRILGTVFNDLDLYSQTYNRYYTRYYHQYGQYYRTEEAISSTGELPAGTKETRPQAH